MRRCLTERYDDGVLRAATLCDWHCFEGRTDRNKIADRTPWLSRQPDRFGFATCDRWSRDYRNQRVAVFRATDAGRPVILIKIQGLVDQLRIARDLQTCIAIDTECYCL